MNEEPNQVNNNNPQQQQVQKSRTPADTEVPQGIKNAANKAAYKCAKALGKVAKQFLKTATKAITAIVSNPVALAVIAIAAFLIIVVVIIYNAKDEVVDNLYKSGKEYMASAFESAGSALSSLGSGLLETTGSIIGYGKGGISALMESFTQDTSDVNEGTDEWSIIQKLSTEIGGGSSVDYLTPDDKASIIQHMYSVSLYDFNNVKWKRYGHGYDGEDSPMTIDTENGVTYPSDQEGTTYETFATLLQPYLLSPEVPMAFFIGLLDNENADYDQAVLMTYSFIKYGLSDITVNRYDVETCTEVTSYKDYDETTYYSQFTATITKQGDGWQVTFSNLSQEQVGETVHVNTRLGDDGNPDYTKEDSVIKPVSTYSNVYYVAEANVFDYKYENEFKYVKYSEDDVKARINWDSEDTEEKPIENNPSAKVTSVSGYYDGSVQLDSVVKSIEEKYGVTLTYNSSNGTYTCKGSNYVERDGTEYFVTRTWSDSLSQSGSTKGFYTVDDVIEYNENCIAGTISEEDFNADTESLEYYEELEENEKLNRMDFINSNPNIFTYDLSGVLTSLTSGDPIGYVSGDPYKKYVGINRKYLEDFCYANLVESWTEMENEYDTFPYKYGLTYGFGSTSDSSSNSYLSGIALLKAYIHTFEGDGTWSYGGRYDENYNHIAETDTETEVAYYKVYDANARIANAPVDITVGYGIDIAAQSDRFKEYDLDYKDLFTRFNSGEEIFIEAEIVDKIEDDCIQAFKESVEDATNGIELTEYQIHALTCHCYLSGTACLTNFVSLYNQYWDEETDDLYETLYETYKDTPEDATSIMNEIDFTNEMYTIFFINFNGDTTTYTGRGQSEYALFSGGYYSTLKQFWGNSAGTPGGYQLTNGNEIDETACIDLQTWFEENIFSNGNHCNTTIYDTTLENTVMTDSQDNDSHGYFNEEYKDLYPYYDTNIKYNIYQCSWWSSFRANLYLRDMGSDKKISTFSDGRSEAKTVANALGLTLNYSIDNIQPYSVISFDRPGSSNGHTAFVEAVTEEYIIISHCGSGYYWHGISAVEKSKLVDKASTYYFVSSVCITDALDN